MISIDILSKSIQQYLNFNHFIPFHPRYGCKNCGYAGLIHRHGYYYRYVVSFNGCFHIPILRLKCPCCHKTYSILPAFVIPYYQYSFMVIFCCLYASFVFKKSYQAILMKLHHFPSLTTLSTSHLSFYIRRIRTYCPFYMPFFLNYPTIYHNMDFHSPTSLLIKAYQLMLVGQHFNHCFFTKMPFYFFQKI